MARRKPRRIWRVVGLSALAFLTALVLVLVALATPPGRAVIAGMIERAASGNGVTIAIDNLTGWPPFWVGADKIVASDAQGPFAEIDDLSVNIQATALLGGNLSLDAITAGRVAVMRRPDVPGGGGGDGALLPFAAKKVQVARLELGKAIAGRPAVLALMGSFVSGANGSIAAKVDASRIDGATATLDATVARADGNAPLTANIALKESADGILLGLMGRSAGPGYTLDAKAGLQGDALAGDLSLTSDGNARFAGHFMLSPAGNGQRLVLIGDGDLAEMVPPDYAGLLAGTVNVAIDADWANVEGEPLPRITIRQGAVTTGSVRVAAQGGLGGGKTDLSLTVDVAKSDGGAIALPFVGGDAQLETLSLTGKAAPSGNVVRLELVGRVAGLQSNDTHIPGAGVSLAIEARQDDPLAGGKLPFGLRIEADAIETATGRLASSAEAPLVLTADGTLDTETGVAETQARLTAAGGAVAFVGTAANGAVKGKATVGFPDIAPLSPLAGRAISGAVDAVADGTIVGPEPAFTVTGTTTDLNPGDGTLARLLAGATKFAATVQGQSGGGVALSDVAIDGAGIKARGGATIGADTIEATLNGSLADLGRLADASTGAATFTLHASGAAARPNLDATIGVADGSLLGQRIENATIDLKGAPTDTGWRAALSLNGGFAGGPLAGTAVATVDRASGRYAFPEVNLSIGNNRITGAIESTTAGPLSGTLTVDAPDVQTLAALALVPASGSGHASVELTPNGASQSLAVTFNGTGITYQGIAANRIDGNIAIDDAFGTPQIRGTASASAMTVGGVRLDTAGATATVEGGATKFEATAKGPDVDLSGSGHLADTAVTIDTLRGTAFRFPVALNQPVTINLDGPQSKIVGASLALGGGSVRVDGAVAPQLDLTIVVTNVAASVANGFSPGLGAEGSLSGRATVTGQPASPAFDWQVDWTGFRVAAARDAGLPALALKASGKGTSTASSVAATLSGAGLSLTVNGHVPFSGAGLNLRASGTAPLALLALRSDRELRLAGNARVDLAISGTLAAPATNGTIDLVDATMADGETGFGVSGANGRITFDGRRATIQQVTGRFAQGGDIAITGSIATDQASLPADLTVRITNGRYSDGNVINTTFSGNLAVKGPLLGNGTVSGQIDLGRTEIQLPDRLGGSATAIDVQHVNAPAGFVPPEPRARPAAAGGAPTGGGLTLDVALSGNRGVFVRGFGIDAELGGALRIAGSTGNPQAIGGLQLQRGRIEAFGRRFEFTRGTLTFAGSLVPVVDFSATTQTSDATVTLNVTGPATNPQISFTSSSGLPQEEVLSRLLFDQGVGTLSAAQALQLVDAVGQLTGATNGGIVSRIRKATGLDDLDIRQSATGGTTVGIGKRINDNVRLGVETGTDSASGRVVIDLDITKNLKASAGAGQDGSGKVGLTYEREY